MTRKTQTEPARRLRCAIYTRKSSEEGLDMELRSGRLARPTSPASAQRAGPACASAMTTAVSQAARWTAPRSSS